MSLSITQTPALVSLAQSPLAFSVAESNANLLTSSSFQYIGQLYYWTGSQFQSSSNQTYTIAKYPNTSGVGIFDVSKIINSTLLDSLYNNPSNVEFYAVDFFTQYWNGTTFITGSHLKSSTYKALDGYGLMNQDAIGQSITASSAFWPLMTDGPATQSMFETNKGYAGVYVGTTGGTQPTKLVYSSSLQSVDYALTSNASSSGQITSYPQAPAQSGFPLSGSYSSYTIQAYDGSTKLGQPILFNFDCEQKYPNVRIMWKNRLGQFDWFNFYMVSRESFDIKRSMYQPQIGTWNAPTLSYAKQDSQNKNYIVDANSKLSVNSFWINQVYNDILKQLLVADEIYWLYDETNNFVRPLSILNQNITFKTGVVDHLIQYQFEFSYGQSYKLIF
jgi:hypothetical protein